MNLLPTNAAHWHLVLNHLPVVGSLAALLLLGWGLIKNTNDLKRVALASLVLVALVSVPAYLTGEPSERFTKGLPAVSPRWMSNHEEMAGFALWAAVGLGAAALAALTACRKSASLPRWVIGVMLAGCTLVCSLMFLTASYGGKIRHSEIRPIPLSAPADNDAD